MVKTPRNAFSADPPDNGETAEDWSRLAEHIRSRRRDLGLGTRPKLAKATGLSERILGDLERGCRAVTDATLSKLEHGLRWYEGSARAVLRGGEATPIGERPPESVDATGPLVRARGLAEAFQIAGDLIESGQVSTGMRLMRALHDAGPQINATTPDYFDDRLLFEQEKTQAVSRKENSGPTVVGMALGRYMVELREASGFTLERVAEILDWQKSDIWLLELGFLNMDKNRIRQLLRLYGKPERSVHQEWMEAAESAQQSGFWTKYAEILPDWLHRYLRLEQNAIAIRTFEAHFIPGLLQTRDYARSIIGFPYGPTFSQVASRRIELQLKARMERQEILTYPSRPALWAIIDEKAITRSFVRREIIVEQIDHLIRMCQRRRAVIQLLGDGVSPLSGFASSFSLLRFGEPIIPDLVYTEQLTGALYIDRSEDVSEYLKILDMLAVYALQPEHSVERLIHLRTQLRGTEPSKRWRAPTAERSDTRRVGK